MLEEIEMPRPCAAWLRHDVFSTVSCTGQPLALQSGQSKRAPVLKSSWISRRLLPASKSEEATNHGDVMPRASCKRPLSRLRHRGQSLWRSILAPSVPPCRTALKGKPCGRAEGRVLDRRPSRRPMLCHQDQADFRPRNPLSSSWRRLVSMTLEDESGAPVMVLADEYLHR